MRYPRAQIFLLAPPQFFSSQVFSKNPSLFHAVYGKNYACLALAIWGFSREVAGAGHEKETLSLVVHFAYHSKWRVCLQAYLLIS